MHVTWESEVERPWIGMTSESMTDVEHARAELVATLDAIKGKLNLPGRIRRSRRRAIHTLRELQVHHPLTFSMILATATATIGGVLFATIRALRHR